MDKFAIVSDSGALTSDNNGAGFASVESAKQWWAQQDEFHGTLGVGWDGLKDNDFTVLPLDDAYDSAAQG